MPERSRPGSPAPAPAASPDGRHRLRADCSRCFGLCCVAPGFSASADFALDKAPGEPCPRLGPDFGCTIHDDLRERGFPGCTVYDCFGAGQRVAQVTFGGRDWRRAPQTAEQMFTVFGVVRQLHELLWYLDEALTLEPARALRGDLGRARDETERLADGRPDELVVLDVAAHRREVDVLLVRTSELVRAGAPGPDADRRRADVIGPDLRPADATGRDLRRADLMGRDLRRADLRAADLRGAYLIGADLRGVRLDRADVIGADLRGARLGGADLRGTIFLTQAQVDSAAGDPSTELPPHLARPSHWTPRATPVAPPSARPG